ncbi:MAG: zinc-binding dehydrogenase [Chloroflexi bacterium]|nr:zinc-binding dehydrogenase [Chloroflexota bacterium]MDA1145379.1 zinc-binding dehydrogenase [Chloroflexota bacterium]
MTLKTRAAIKAKFGEPLLVDEIELADPGDEEVLVKLFATGICHSQLHQIHNPDGPVPTLLGHEGTGIVLKAGSKVTHVKEGERVMIQFVPRDLPEGMTTANRTKYTWQGNEYEAGVYTWAEHALLNEQMVVPLPNDVPTDVTAIIGCAVITGAGAALYTAGVQPGQSVAVFGVGGVGSNVVAGAKIAGAYPIIAVDLEEGKLGYAKELGATHTVNGSDVHAPDAVKELTGGGVDFAFDAIGVQAAFLQSVESVKSGVLGVSRGGAAVIVGIGQGDVPLPRLFPFGERTIMGSMGGSERPAIAMPKYIEWYKEGKLPLEKLVSKKYDNLDEINEGVRALENGEIEGRSIIVYATP